MAVCTVGALGVACLLFEIVSVIFLARVTFGC